MVVATRVEKEIRLIDGQADLLTDWDSRILAGIAGTGGGKTILGYWWLHTRMERYPNNTWGLAEPTYSMLAKVILESSDPGRPSLEGYFRDVGHHPELHKVDRILYTDFGKIYLGSADNPDSMQGAAVKGYWLDEAGQMALLAHETAFQRCSMLSGQELLTTTPYNMGWLLTHIKRRTGEGGIHVETWRSIDRPGFPLESYEIARKNLPMWRFRMLYDAEFERPEGLVYNNFDERVCVIDRIPINKRWLIYAGHDFGPDNPGALFYAKDPDTGIFYLFSEYLPGSGVSVYERVEHFKSVTQGYDVIMRCGGSPAEEEARQAYTNSGWPIMKPLWGQVDVQIQKVIDLHAVNRIMVFRDLEHYLDEKRTYSYDIGNDNKVSGKIHNASSYHLMDCERYIMSQFDTPMRATGKYEPRSYLKVR